MELLRNKKLLIVISIKLVIAVYSKVAGEKNLLGMLEAVELKQIIFCDVTISVWFAVFRGNT